MHYSKNVIYPGIKGILHRMRFLLVIVFITSLSAMQQDKQSAQPVFNVLQYGAAGDGKTLDTKAIQQAIDEATKVGNNARVLVPAGHQYLVGTLELKSAIDFHLQGDATRLTELRQSLSALYAQGSSLDTLSDETFNAIDILAGIDVFNYTPAQNAEYPETEFGMAMMQVAQIAKAKIGRSAVGIHAEIRAIV